jgi:ornithine carbamoyltransferase
VASRNALKYGGSYRKVATMEEAFKDADIVYPKSWAPFSIMEQRTRIVEQGDDAALKALEQRCLANNATYKDWTCSENLMKTTKNGKALYLHCLPADITGVSCKEGEVDASVFDRYLTPLYKQASYKPYVIAAMILLQRFQNPAKTLDDVLKRSQKRVF